MAEDRTLGQVFHEAGRVTVNAERDKPFDVRPWAERTGEQREVDERGASAVAAEAVRRAGLDLAAKEMAVRQRQAKLSAIAERIARVPQRGAYLTPEQELAEDLFDIITGKETPS